MTPADWKDALRALGASEPLPDTPTDTSDYQPQTHDLTVFYEKKGRAGKAATIIAGFDPDPRAGALLQDVASRLKGALAVGGSARGGEILLQGDCRKRAAEELRKMGYRVKGA